MVRCMTAVSSSAAGAATTSEARGVDVAAAAPCSTEAIKSNSSSAAETDNKMASRLGRDWLPLGSCLRTQLLRMAMAPMLSELICVKWSHMAHTICGRAERARGVWWTNARRQR